MISEPHEQKEEIDQSGHTLNAPCAVPYRRGRHSRRSVTGWRLTANRATRRAASRTTCFNNSANQRFWRQEPPSSKATAGRPCGRKLG